MKKFKWFAIGLCGHSVECKELLHIEFFNSKLKALECMYKYLFMYGTAYMGEVK